MTTLVAGLVVFLGVHSIGVLAPGWRATQAARLGAHPWKLAFSVASIVGLVLIVVGYRAARLDPVVLWTAPLPARHVTALLTVVAFVLIAAAYVPGTHIKAALGHPMTAGVGLWAAGHLRSNGRLHAVVLFGAFVAWSVVVFTMRRRRDHDAGKTYPAGSIVRDTIATVIGVVAAVAFALFLHGPLIGVRPFG